MAQGPTRHRKPHPAYAGIKNRIYGSPVRFLTDNEVCKPALRKLGFSEGYELCLCVGFGYADSIPEAKPRDPGKVRFVVTWTFWVMD